MTTQSFSYTGAVQYWTVPPGVISAEFELWGAEGGQGATISTSLVPLGGKGGYVKAQVDVTPGDIIEIFTPGKGTNGILYTGVGSTVALGGFPTNTAGQANTGYNGSAGGGGHAIVIKQTLGWRIFAGGGGGGGVVAGTSSGHTPTGGDGGYTPTDGVGDPASPFSPSSGGGGLSSGPGGNRYFADTASSGGTTGSASNAKGAGGGGGFPLGNGGGAANGGPYKGGGGQGGTSWSLGSEVTILDDATGVRTGDGLITIKFGPASTFGFNLSFGQRSGL